MEYTSIPEDRFDDVIKHLRNNFYVDEPLSNAVGLCKKGEGHKEYEEFNYQNMQNGFNLMAVAPDGEIAGVLLSAVSQPGRLEIVKKKINMSDDEKFKKIFNFIFGQSSKFDLFEKFQVDRIFHLRVLSVDSKYRGKGIGKELVKRSIAQAENCGFKVLKTDTTGAFSQKIMKSCGFETLYKVNYAEYTDELGKPIFIMESPHTNFEILYKQLK
ncbi:arylalkylamine N-acetyltransferase 1-like [Episyrphus balteatus]|uniref:arylalkylamine N-acetyltransferase 1-like n=1 Tax=Episyrphus balteatus TaxID=286459 RepID=UPI0024854F6D|nr:arylalkylamine N-acetyltransferase 1-like [Episyrphus balteatus]XP_055854495.1 arylalkylamine N-acetyltransferase 1-like [Episyrphus balteatus]